MNSMITKKWANTAANLMAFVRLVCPPSGYLHRRARIDIIGLPSEMLSEKYTYDVAERIVGVWHPSTTSRMGT